MISHPHSDHISNIKSIDDNINPDLLTCPHNKLGEINMPDERVNFSRINNPKGTENIINTYKALFEGDKRKLPLQTISYDGQRYIPNLEYGIYYLRPPIVAEVYPNDDQKYSNGISILLYFRFGKNNILLTGDITPEIMKKILEDGEGVEKRFTVFDKEYMSSNTEWSQKTVNQPSLKKLLSTYGLTILQAPHHGLESGYSEDLYNIIKNEKPNLVVISEKRHTGENDGQIDNRYQKDVGASGLSVNIEQKRQDVYSVSTRKGHHILMVFNGNMPNVYLEKTPEELLNRI